MRLEHKLLLGIVGYACCMGLVAVFILISRGEQIPEDERCGWIACSLLENARSNAGKFKGQAIKALLQQANLLADEKAGHCPDGVHANQAKQIGIITLSSGENYEVVGPATSKNKREYALMHGHPFHDETGSPTLARVAGWAAQWQKIPAVLSRLYMHEWLLWLDSDVVIMNFDITVQSKFPSAFRGRTSLKEGSGADNAINENNDIHLILSADDSGINTGAFLIRNCSWSVQFFEEVLKETKWARTPYHEQTTMLKLMNENPEHKKHILLDPTISSYGISRGERGARKYTKGDFLVHLTGACRYQARCEKKVLPLVELSELLREESQWRKVHKNALVSLSRLEGATKERCKDEGDLK